VCGIPSKFDFLKAEPAGACSKTPAGPHFAPAVGSLERPLRRHFLSLNGQGLGSRSLAYRGGTMIDRPHFPFALSGAALIEEAQAVRCVARQEEQVS
jgi:hypothetical protein